MNIDTEKLNKCIIKTANNILQKIDDHNCKFLSPCIDIIKKKL